MGLVTAVLKAVGVVAVESMIDWDHNSFRHQHIAADSFVHCSIVVEADAAHLAEPAEVDSCQGVISERALGLNHSLVGGDGGRVEDRA